MSILFCHLFIISREAILHYGIPLISMGISFIALTLAIFSLYKVLKIQASTKRVGDRSRSAKHTAQQGVEFTIASLVSSSRIKMDEAEHSLKLFKDRHPEQSDEFPKKTYTDSIEEYLKTFDKACMLYLEGKFDRDKFIKEYKPEIRKIAEKEEFYSRYFDSATIANKCRSIQKVYEKWENVEK